MKSEDEIRFEYQARHPLLVKTAQALEKHLSGLLENLSRIDRVSARAKSLDRYVAKATKKNADGFCKYQNPIFDIQDQIGARIVVFYLQDVEHIKSVVEKYLRFIEVTDKHPNSDAEFGYFGLHYIVNIPEDIISEDTDGDTLPDFFELQIKTLFQHAWSEAHHDLGYKSMRDLTALESRKIAFTGAQAWGADAIFKELSHDLVFNDNEPDHI